MAMTASEARRRLFPLIEQVNEDRRPVEITSLRGDAVLLSKADYDELQETAFLLRVPANASDCSKASTKPAGGIVTSMTSTPEAALHR